MPYCPKCDMEFVDGITTCSDCGGPLVASKEIADSIKQKQKEEELAKKRAEWEAMQAEWAAETERSNPEDTDASSQTPPDGSMAHARSAQRTQVYVKKSQQYEDLKSSASAFFLVGGALTVFSVFCWANVVALPLAGTSESSRRAS